MRPQAASAAPNARQSAAQQADAQQLRWPCRLGCSPCSERQPVRSVWMLRAEERSHTRAVPSVEPVTTKRAQGSIASAVMPPVWPASGARGVRAGLMNGGCLDDLYSRQRTCLGHLLLACRAAHTKCMHLPHSHVPQRCTMTQCQD